MKVLISLFCTIGFLLSNAQSISVQPAEKVYISTDRYYYKPGEKIYYSVFVASDSSLENKFTKSVRVWLVDPSGRDLDSGTFTFQNQENASFFYLPQTGGIYSIRAVSVQQMNQKHPNYFTKEIYVQSFVKKSFFIELKKDKNNYSYTDTLGGLLSFLSSGNMKLNRLPYKIHLLQAGERIWTEEGMSSAQGDSRIAVPLAGGLNSEEPLFIYIETSFKGILYSHMEKVPMNDKQIVLTVFFESGLDGYVPGSTNKLVLKSTDMLGNDLDIAAELRDNTGRLICNIKSVHKGLAPFQFVPESNMTYKIVARNNREIQLLPSKETIGFQIDFLETGFQRVNLNRDPDRDMVLVWSGKGKILKEIMLRKGEKMKPLFVGGYDYTGVVGLALYDGNSSGKLIAKRTLFAGYSNLARANIDIADSIFYNEANYIRISHTDKLWAKFSLSIIEESNIRLMEDHNHSMLSWMLLGYEFYETIEDPQYYFDPGEKDAQKHLHLLMYTLFSSWQRDVKSGLVFANPEFRFELPPIEISGLIYDSYDELSPHTKISLYNSSISTYSDSAGRFTMKIPRELTADVKLIISRRGEKNDYKVHNIYRYQNDFAFVVSKRLAEVDKESDFSEDVITSGPEFKLGLPDQIKERRELEMVEISYDMDEKPQGMAIYDAPAPASRSFMNNALISSIKLTYVWDFSESEPWYFTTPFSVKLDPPKDNKKESRTTTAVNQGSTKLWLAYLTLVHDSVFIYQLPNSDLHDGYRILVEGVDARGKTFYAEKFFRVIRPLDYQVNIPETAICGDRLQIPVTISNNKQDTVRLGIWNNKNHQDTTELILLPGQTATSYVIYDVPGHPGESQFRIRTFSDVENKIWSQNISVSDYSIEGNAAISGLENRKEQLNLSTVEFSSVQAIFKVKPSFEDEVLETSQNIIRMPSGCFEQVSSSNYPNVAALLMLQRASKANSDFYNTAMSYLSTGYQKMTSYETSTGGFEWFGRADGHEALTAYGLLQFFLMKMAGFKIDNEMFERNKQWLLKRKDGKGGYLHRFGLDAFGRGTKEASDTYITWVLSRIGEKNIAEDIAKIKQNLNKEFDAYQLALLVNILRNMGDAQFELYYSKLIKHISDNEFKELQAEHSVVGSKGKSLDVEILALTLLASTEKSRTAFLEEVKNKLISLKDPRGMFGNTQSTALAIEAISYFLNTDKLPAQVNYKLWVNGNYVLFTWDKNNMNNNQLAIPREYLIEGTNDISIEIEDNSPEYSLNVYWKEKRLDIQHEEISMKAEYQEDSLQMGQSSVLRVEIENRTALVKPQVVATINLPSGVSIPTEQLRELIRKGEIDYYEINGNQIHLYMLSMNPNEIKIFYISFRAEYPGSFRTLANNVFEYYQPEVSARQVSPILTILPN